MGEPCEETLETLSDAAVVWAVLNLMDDVYTDARDVQSVQVARAALDRHISDHELSGADLFEHLAEAVEEDDLARFGLGPPHGD